VAVESTYSISDTLIFIVNFCPCNVSLLRVTRRRMSQLNLFLSLASKLYFLIRDYDYYSQRNVAVEIRYDTMRYIYVRSKADEMASLV